LRGHKINFSNQEHMTKCIREKGIKVAITIMKEITSFPLLRYEWWNSLGNEDATNFAPEYSCLSFHEIRSLGI